MWQKFVTDRHTHWGKTVYPPFLQRGGHNYHYHICIYTCRYFTAIVLNALSENFTCGLCHITKQIIKMVILFSAYVGNNKWKFIPFLYKGTYFECIKMKYITARETKGPLMPKIIGKRCLKVKINKKVKNHGVAFERTK